VIKIKSQGFLIEISELLIFHLQVVIVLDQQYFSFIFFSLKISAKEQFYLQSKLVGVTLLRRRPFRQSDLSCFRSANMWMVTSSKVRLGLYLATRY
jgi:hypothetical protein